MRKVGKTEITKPNVIFIIIDAVRARNVGAYGYDKPTTPNIDRIAQKGVLFRDAYSCTNLTESSLTSMFSGLYSYNHGITNIGMTSANEAVKNFARSEASLLPEILQSHSYNTLAVDWLGRWHQRGYDYYSGVEELSETKFLSYAKRVVSSYKFLRPFETAVGYLNRRVLQKAFEASVITNQAMKLVQNNRGGPFFLMLHYWDVHQGYSPPSKYTNMFYNLGYSDTFDSSKKMRTVFEYSDSKTKKIARALITGNKTVGKQLAEYDGAIRYVDDEIGRLMEHLDKLGLAENTLIIITSDHGESLTEHGIYFDHHGLYDVSIQVPLVMKYPAVLPECKTVDGFVQHTDMVPTILNLLGIENDPIAFDGESILPLIHQNIQLRHSVFIEEAYAQKTTSIRTKQYAYLKSNSIANEVCKVCGIMHGDAEQLYNLEMDPEQNHSIIHEEPKMAQSMQTLMSEWKGFLSKKQTTRGKGRIRNKIAGLRGSGKL